MRPRWLGSRRISTARSANADAAPNAKTETDTDTKTKTKTNTDAAGTNTIGILRPVLFNCQDLQGRQWGKAYAATDGSGDTMVQVGTIMGRKRAPKTAKEPY